VDRGHVGTLCWNPRKKIKSLCVGAHAYCYTLIQMSRMNRWQHNDRDNENPSSKFVSSRW
jgi:hypothetical protein